LGAGAGRQLVAVEKLPIGLVHHRHGRKVGEVHIDPHDAVHAEPDALQPPADCLHDEPCLGADIAMRRGAAFKIARHHPGHEGVSAVADQHRIGGALARHARDDVALDRHPR
jgi:hypothetical protein